MKLQQGQTWKLDQQYLRIARLDRLAVEYKVITDLITKAGARHRVTKKEFCRLVKGAVLLTNEDLAAARDTGSELLSSSEIEAASSESQPEQCDREQEQTEKTEDGNKC